MRVSKCLGKRRTCQQLNCRFITNLKGWKIDNSKPCQQSCQQSQSVSAFELPAPLLSYALLLCSSTCQRKGHSSNLLSNTFEGCTLCRSTCNPQYIFYYGNLFLWLPFPFHGRHQLNKHPPRLFGISAAISPLLQHNTGHFFQLPAGRAA